ncbi:hypothetical protein [Flavobacterium sp. 3HN19-14]|uniref:hypothetical protein n=1 Tax=Flavobacterium sp. 3HN19-14 TaxID=3448133 RepID=UPI003EDE89E9
MKKILVALFFVFVCNNTLKAQNVTGTEAQVKTTLCKSWTIDYAMSKGKKISMPVGAEGFRMVFKTDNTYEVKNAPEGNANDKWVYDAAAKMVVIYRNGKAYSNISTLTDTEMIISPPKSEMDFG